MASVDAIREQVLNKLPDAVELGSGLLRSDRKYNGKTFSTAYIDLSDNVVERSKELWKFQEDLLGAEFFEGGNQRWNSYLYFWAGPKSTSHPRFGEAKSYIEGDRHFARKFVLTDAELLSRLEDLAKARPKSTIREDVRAKWEEELRRASLGSLLEQKPRTQLITSIENEDAFAAEISAPTKKSVGPPDLLDEGCLQSIRVERFRPKTSGKPFTFADVNLIVGPNGSGKTSLLELIEAFYCGRVRRDGTATFRGLEAKIRTRDGRLVDVEGQTDATTIKRRNLMWYGRSDYHSAAISDSFARFNFLDTDAAYRLYSEVDAGRIDEALRSLLVGPETSTCWTHLTKLHDDISVELRSLDERLSSLSAQRELLQSEVKRLRVAPSRAASHAKTYRASLRVLRATWVGRDDAPIDSSDRARLEKLSHGFGRALAVPSASPLTANMLRVRHAALNGALKELLHIHEKCIGFKEDLESREAEVVLRREEIEVLQQWRKYCEMGIGDLVASIDRVSKQVEEIRLRVGSVAVDAISELPAEYASMTVDEALKMAEANLALAKTEEQRRVENLNQREELKRSLRSLKNELGSLARAVIQRSGDAMHCPVCGTLHETDQLLSKVDALADEEQSAGEEGLVLAIEEGRQRTRRESRLVAVIRALGRYAKSSRAPESATVADLREKLVAAQSQLDDLVAEWEQLLSQRASVTQRGLEVERYYAVRDAAVAVLSADEDVVDINNVDEVGTTIRERNRNIEKEEAAIKALQEDIERDTHRARSIVDSLGVDAPQARLEELVAVVRGEFDRISASISFLEEATREIDIPGDRSLEALRADVDAAIEVFDRAQHAEAEEDAGRTELGRKSLELLQVDAEVEEAKLKRHRLSAAEGALRRIREKYSVEEASREALESIRQQVGYIFARIHTPCEYEIGDLDGDSILVTREGKECRKIYQVSTGQRAALALSIFLALNQSAERAPPIVLIDDPVAHIDDLNVLSFFDYLRDLVVADRKQIFFATSDTRIAALFEKKFNFLGEDRFKEIRLVG